MARMIICLALFAASAVAEEACGLDDAAVLLQGSAAVAPAGTDVADEVSPLSATSKMEFQERMASKAQRLQKLKKATSMATKLRKHAQKEMKMEEKLAKYQSLEWIKRGQMQGMQDARKQAEARKDMASMRASAEAEDSIKRNKQTFDESLASAKKEQAFQAKVEEYRQQQRQEYVQTEQEYQAAQAAEYAKVADGFKAWSDKEKAAATEEEEDRMHDAMEMPAIKSE